MRSPEWFEKRNCSLCSYMTEEKKKRIFLFYSGTFVLGPSILCLSLPLLVLHTFLFLSRELKDSIEEVSLWYARHSLHVLVTPMEEGRWPAAATNLKQ